MPRILAPDEPSAPGAVINLPRPREVDPAPTALPEFGAAIGDTGNMLLQEAVRQDRRAERLRINTAAEERYSELRRQVDEAGTATDARTLWQREAPKAKQELARFAQERGLPEMAAELDFHAAQHNGEAVSAINRRSFGEGIDATRTFAAAKEEAIASAASEPEALRHRTDLHRELQQVARDNPLLSPGDADLLFQSTVSTAATRRVGAMIAGAADNPSALAQLRDRLADETNFPDLPGDRRAAFQATIVEQIDRAESRAERDRLTGGARSLSDVLVGAEDATSLLQLDQAREQIDSLFAQELITPSQRVAAVRSIQQRRGELGRIDQTLLSAAESYQAGLGLSQAETDALYTDQLTKLEAQLPEDAIPQAQDELAFRLAGTMAARGSRVPSQIKDRVIGAAERVESPAFLARAANADRTIRELAPNADTGAGERVAIVNTLVERADMTADDAAALVVERIPDRPTVARRAEEFQELAKDFDATSFLQDRGIAPARGVLSPLTTTADIPDAALVDAERTFEAFYRLYGNESVALDATADTLGRRWGVTAVEGTPRLMRNPPENRLPGELSPEQRVSIVRGEIGRMLAELEIEPAEPPPGLEDTPPWIVVSRPDLGPDSVEVRVLSNAGLHIPPLADRPLIYTVPTGEELADIPEFQAAAGEGIAELRDRQIAREQARLSGIETEQRMKRQTGAAAEELEALEAEAEAGRQRIEELLAKRAALQQQAP